MSLMAKIKSWVAPVLLGALAFVSDLSSKCWANESLHFGSSEIFIPGFLRFTLTKNTGGAFGIARGNSFFILLLVVLILLGIIIWVVKKERSEFPLKLMEKFGIAIIIGAALGNLWDRLQFGSVTDFIEFSFIEFPVFNVADVLIDLGAILVILASFFSNPILAEKRASSSEIDE